MKIKKLVRICQGDLWIFGIDFRNRIGYCVWLKGGKYLMNEMMDQLEQVIEERVMQLKGKMEEEKSQTDQAEKEEYIMHVERILNSLSEEEREWLDDQMMKKLDVPNQERLRYYKAGLADAIEVMRYLRT
jgi:uncharacterized secreted protein with C-terminal beta-propeller domain